jgi:hypothetical protein
MEKDFVKTYMDVTDEEIEFFVYQDVLTNKAYHSDKQNIKLLLKNGQIVDLTEASDNLNISALAQPVEKYFLCFPKYH